MLDRKLQAFVRVAELHSFTAAAESLYISQSALSQQIKLLEQQLGFALFDRRQRGAALTQAGAAFLPRAQQLLALYENSVQEGRTITLMEQQHRARLKAGCLDNHIFTVWPALYALLPETCKDSVNPRPARYPSRIELYRALLRGAEDMAVQLENDELYRFGLQFHPITSIPVVCKLFLPTPEIEAKESFAIEDLLQCDVCFHYEQGNSLYEDALRRRLKQAKTDLRVLEPADFFSAKTSAEDRRTILLLVPSIQYPGDPALVRPLEWEEGARIGFVTAADCGRNTLDYIAQVRAAAAEHPELWQWQPKR